MGARCPSAPCPASHRHSATPKTPWPFRPGPSPSKPGFAHPGEQDPGAAGAFVICWANISRLGLGGPKYQFAASSPVLGVNGIAPLGFCGRGGDPFAGQRRRCCGFIARVPPARRREPLRCEGFAITWTPVGSWCCSGPRGGHRGDAATGRLYGPCHPDARGSVAVSILPFARRCREKMKLLGLFKGPCTALPRRKGPGWIREARAAGAAGDGAVGDRDPRTPGAAAPRKGAGAPRASPLDIAARKRLCAGWVTAGQGTPVVK